LSFPFPFLIPDHSDEDPDLFDSTNTSFYETQAAHNFLTAFGKSKTLRVLGDGSTSVVARALHQHKVESYAVRNILKLVWARAFDECNRSADVLIFCKPSGQEWRE
jgi:hypothetical protein